MFSVDKVAMLGVGRHLLIEHGLWLHFVLLLSQTNRVLLLQLLLLLLCDTRSVLQSLLQFSNPLLLSLDDVTGVVIVTGHGGLTGGEGGG